MLLVVVAMGALFSLLHHHNHHVSGVTKNKLKKKGLKIFALYFPALKIPSKFPFPKMITWSWVPGPPAACLFNLALYTLVGILFTNKNWNQSAPPDLILFFCSTRFWRNFCYKHGNVRWAEIGRLIDALQYKKIANVIILISRVFFESR